MIRKGRVATALVLGTLAGAFVGCNQLLDNGPAQLASEEAGTVPSPPLSEGDSSVTQPTEPVPEAGTATDASDGDATTTPGCPQGQHMCNGICVSATDPLYGCGDPSCKPCAKDHATAACQGNKCIVGSCDKGYADCDGKSDNGCEGDLSKATSCGSCNAVCPAATPLCAPAADTFQCQTGCTPAAPLLCGTQCVDPLTSNTNCGGCNVTCPTVANGTTACKTGVCAFDCKKGFHACGNTCAQNTDPTMCGAACTVCPVPANGKATCANDACVSTCNTGYADCDANPANGCEAALKSDPLNCGACGKSCNGQACNNGVCATPPPPPDAGADAGDGGAQ